MLGLGEPAILFEDKVLYGQRMYADGRVCDLVGYDFVDERHNYAIAYPGDPDECDCLLITPGGLANHAIDAARTLLMAEDLACQVVVLSQLYPFDITPLMPLIRRAGRVCVIEEGVAGGTWGTEVAAEIHERLWHELRAPVLLVNSARSVIPTAPELERAVLVQRSTVHDAIREAFHA
jgi:pyruvate dehydrogenase E1 component beta subunit